MSYGADTLDAYREVGIYAGRRLSACCCAAVCCESEGWLQAEMRAARDGSDKCPFRKRDTSGGFRFSRRITVHGCSSFLVAAAHPPACNVLLIVAAGASTQPRFAKPPVGWQRPASASRKISCLVRICSIQRIFGIARSQHAARRPANRLN
jgi:hypothetical protein